MITMAMEMSMSVAKLPPNQAMTVRSRVLMSERSWARREYWIVTPIAAPHCAKAPWKIESSRCQSRFEKLLHRRTHHYHQR
jgi:hypothetical protein